MNTITALEVSENLPMSVIILDRTNQLYGIEVEFFKARPVSTLRILKKDWYLMGRTQDKSNFYCTADKDEKFGVVE